jgi:hypothetical protein
MEADAPTYDQNGRVRGVRGPAPELSKLDVAQVIHWRLWKAIPSIKEDAREYIERVWSRKIPRIYEVILAAAQNGDFVNPMSLDILKTMTLMTRSLTPATLRADSNADALGLPSDVDLSHISTADLARMTRKELSAPLDHNERDRKAAHAKMMRQKKADAAAGKREKTGPHSDRRKKVIPNETPK